MEIKQNDMGFIDSVALQIMSSQLSSAMMTLNQEQIEGLAISSYRYATTVLKVRKDFIKENGVEEAEENDSWLWLTPAAALTSNCRCQSNEEQNAEAPKPCQKAAVESAKNKETKKKSGTNEKIVEKAADQNASKPATASGSGKKRGRPKKTEKAEAST